MTCDDSQWKKTIGHFKNQQIKFQTDLSKIVSTTLTYLSLLASRSDSSNVKMSPSRTGPFTLRMMDLFVSSRNSTRT